MATFVFGLVLLAGAAAVFYFDRKPVRDDRRADAEVVDLQPVRHPASQGQWVCYPVVRFRAEDGREVVAKMGTAYPGIRRGRRLRIVYQTGTRTEVAIDPVRTGWVLTGGLLAVIGLFLVALGIAQMIPHRAHAAMVGVVMLFLFGLAFPALGLRAFYQDRRLVRDGGRAEAEVLRVDKEAGEGGEGWQYRPVVRFRTPDGAVIVALAGAVPFRPNLSPGDRVEVLYETRNPEYVAIDTVAGRGLTGAAIFVIAGLGMLAYAVYLVGW